MVPVVTPYTTPATAPTVPTGRKEELHVPPLVALANVVVSPIQVLGNPVIAAGKGSTVTILVVRHPAPIV
jgi:hypothetical protein